MNGSAGGHAALECRHHQFGQLGDRFMDAAGCGCRATFYREKCLGDSDGYLAGLKGHHGTVTLNDPQFTRRSGGNSAANDGRFLWWCDDFSGSVALVDLCLHVLSEILGISACI